MPGTGQLWNTPTHHGDLTGQRGKAAYAAKVEADQAAEVAKIRAEGRPGADQVMTMATLRALAASGDYRDGEPLGLSPSGQPVVCWDGEPLVTDARVNIPQATG